MPRNYTKMEELTAAVLARKAAGESNRQIGESYGLSRRQIEQLVNRQNRKRRKLEAGITIRPKGRPRKSAQTPEAEQEQEIRQLRIQKVNTPSQAEPVTVCLFCIIMLGI